MERAILNSQEHLRNSDTYKEKRGEKKNKNRSQKKKRGIKSIKKSLSENECLKTRLANIQNQKHFKNAI